jgi:carboxymethylenebutenolidase
MTMLNRTRRSVRRGLYLLGLLGALGRAPASGVEIEESQGSYESQKKTISIERFEPKAKGKYPAVVLIHGAGGMRIGGFLYRQTARQLAENGYVVHAIHYFESTGTEKSDLKSNLANFRVWIKTVGDGVTNITKQPNVDPERIGLLGYSLGSYLALSLAATDPRISAVVEYFGGLPGGRFRDLKKMPPVLILHGEADKIVPVKEAQTLERLFKENNVPFEMKLYPKQGHGFFGPDAHDASQRALSFLNKHMKKA